MGVWYEVLIGSMTGFVAEIVLNCNYVITPSSWPQPLKILMPTQLLLCVSTLYGVDAFILAIRCFGVSTVGIYIPTLGYCKKYSCTGIFYQIWQSLAVFLVRKVSSMTPAAMSTVRRTTSWPTAAVIPWTQTWQGISGKGPSQGAPLLADCSTSTSCPT